MSDPSSPSPLMSSAATTRRYFQRKLLSLSEENQDLQSKLETKEQECSTLREKARLQELQIKEMENTIHTVFSSDAQGTSTCASSDKLLLEKSRQIAELTLKLEQLSATLEDSQSNSNDVISSQCHSELTQAALSHVSASQYSWAVDHHGSCSQVKILSQDLNDFKQKCVSLERSMATLKRKNGEREIRSAQNLRMMRQQLDVVERQKARSLEKQRAMEQQILDLLKENKEKTERIALVEQSSEKCNKRDFFRHNGHGMYNDAKNHSKTDFWKDDEESYFPPILVASSLDDDTASETESQAGGLEK